jgi:hypothetical protein
MRVSTSAICAVTRSQIFAHPVRYACSLISWVQGPTWNDNVLVRKVNNREHQCNSPESSSRATWKRHYVRSRETLLSAASRGRSRAERGRENSRGRRGGGGVHSDQPGNVESCDGSHFERGLAGTRVGCAGRERGAAVRRSR